MQHLYGIQRNKKGGDIIMNYTLDFDTLGQIEYPQVILCNRNKKKYGELFPVNKLKIKMQLNAPNEISFDMHKIDGEGRKHPLWDKLVDLKLVYIKKFGYFVISVSRKNELGNDEIKTISGKSLEIELGQYYLNDFQVNVPDNDISDNDYEPIVFCNILNVKHSLLHLALKKAPNWSIGHVDESLCAMQRTFDVNGITIYDFFTGDVSTEFNCLFQFDDFLRKINVYDLDTYGNDTSVYISHDNLLKSVTIEANSGEIKNCLKVSAGEGIYINEVNPNGSDYLWNFTDEDKRDMSEQLVTLLDDYNTIYQGNMQRYENIMKRLQQQIDVILELEHRLPSIDGSTDWTTYGLVALKEQLDAHLAIEDTYKDAGFGNISNASYYLYNNNHSIILAIEIEYKKRKNEIKTQNAVYNSIKAERDALFELLDIQKFLSSSGDDTLWKELQLYRREQLYENLNYSTTDITTEDERFQLELDLYQEATKKLNELRRPHYNFTTTMDNILAIPDFQEQNISKFRLGNFIRVGLDNDNEIYRTRLITIGINFDSLNSLDVEFSEFTESGEIENGLEYILNQASSAATGITVIQKQYDRDKNKINWVRDIINNGLNAALTDVYNADNMETTINNRGIICRKWNDGKQDYELEQMHLINNKIVFTDDAWRSCRMALGKIHIVNPSGGETDCYGLIADALIGKLMITESMYIGNKNNTFTIDDKGFSAYSQDKNTVIKIDPNKNDGLVEIYKDYQKSTIKKIFWTDIDGNLHITGSLEACRFIATNGVNTIDINPDSPTLFKISNASGDVIYFDQNGDAYYKGNMTIGKIYSENYLASNGAEGSMLNLTDGTFQFANKRLRLTPTGLTTYDNTLTKYTEITGGEVTCFSTSAAYIWMGKSYTGMKIYTKMYDGIIRTQFDDGTQNIFVTPSGISTTPTAGTNSTGIIDFYSTVYGNNYSGITMRTFASPVALMSAQSHVVLNPKADSSTNAFMVNVNNSGSGEITYGDYKNKRFVSALAFDATNAIVKVTDGNTSLGKLVADSIQINSGTLGGKAIASKSDLDSLEGEWRNLLQTSYNNGYSQGYSDGWSDGWSSAKT